MEAQETANARRHDIDWLRVILFALLIWFHYAVFSLWQLEGSSGGMEAFNLVLFFVLAVMHQFRLCALFWISGAGTAFAFRRRSWRVYLNERAIRLGIPLLFGVYVLWFGMFDPIETTRLLFTIFPGSEEMPYGHLWFLVNLGVYSAILTPLFAHIRENPDSGVVSLTRRMLRMPAGIGLMLLPALVLSANAILFKPWAFGEVGMWWEFPRYLLYFVFGYLMIAAKEDYFPALDRIRIPVTIITPLLSVVWFVAGEASGVPNVNEGGWADMGHPAFSLSATLASLIQSFHAWFWCLLVFSWASRLLNRPSKWLSYLNEAVYPTYIVHMHLTFLPIVILPILGAGYYLGLTVGTAMVMVGVMVCFEVVRRARFARPLFGIKGGREEVVKLWPYNQTEDDSLRTVLSLVFHALSLGVVFVMYVFLISAEWIGG